MATTRHDRVKYDSRNGYEVLDLPGVEIWDGADLCLLRDTLFNMIGTGQVYVGIEMASVKFIPTGFFGMLSDWQDKGIRIRLYNPQPNVAGMLWFRRFFENVGNGTFHMLRDGLDLPSVSAVFADDAASQPVSVEMPNDFDEAEAEVLEQISASCSPATSSEFDTDCVTVCSDEHSREEGSEEFWFAA